MAPESAPHRLYFLLTQAQHCLARYADEGLQAELGISAAQCGALMFLRAHDACQLSALGDGLGLASSAVTGLVARLERARLVTRSPHPRDGRASLLGLSAKGRRVVEAALPRVRAFSAEMRAGFSADELDTVARFLRAQLQRFTEKS